MEALTHCCCDGQLAQTATHQYLYSVSKRFQIILTDEQYAFLNSESDRSSVSVSELIRRAVDTTYGVLGGDKIHLITHTLGRRSGRAIDDPHLSY